MFEEPAEQPQGRTIDPADRAREKSDELRMHAELAAVFEGGRKFDARILPGLDAKLARDLQQTMGRLEKVKLTGTPVIADESAPEAKSLLIFSDAHGLSTNDYHVCRRPGETMIVRWLAAKQVDAYYDRLQAHFDAALDGCKEDERQALQWKGDPKTLAYLAALDAVQVNMAERYLREIIRQHRIFVLSTQAADEINIAYLCDHVMGAGVAEVVGAASAPQDDAAEHDLAWFFKLFSLRGIVEDVERMCFFAYLQKSDDTFDEGG